MSLQIIVDNQSTLKAWAAARLEIGGPWPQSTEALGIIDAETGAIRAVLIVVQTYAEQCDVSIATDESRKWATRNILGGIFGFIFLIKRNKIARVTISHNNVPSLVMCIKMGWQIEGRIRDADNEGSDGIIMSMTRDECVWIKEAPSHG